VAPITQTVPKSQTPLLTTQPPGSCVPSRSKCDEIRGKIMGRQRLTATARKAWPDQRLRPITPHAICRLYRSSRSQSRLIFRQIYRSEVSSAYTVMQRVSPTAGSIHSGKGMATMFSVFCVLAPTYASPIVPGHRRFTRQNHSRYLDSLRG
jgi:hypothetical protein